jgi:hypothetical protein
MHYVETHRCSIMSIIIFLNNQAKNKKTKKQKNKKTKKQKNKKTKKNIICLN